VRHGDHDPTVEPFDCCFAALNELASSGEDRAELLEHGERALWELNRQRDAALDEMARLRREMAEARAWAWGDAHGMMAWDWAGIAGRPYDGTDTSLPEWMTTDTPPDEQDWWPGVRTENGPTE